jgi:nitrite reductase/ring-hydroxylating ferredoxin subunit
MTVADWTNVETGEVPEGEMIGVSVDGEELLVANVGGRYHALGAVCTHEGCNLAELGQIDGDELSCQCHGSVFDLNTGEVVSPPADEPLPVYDVRVEGDAIQVRPRAA